MKTSAETDEGYIDEITSQQWDSFFKNFFEPCIEAWNLKNRGREFILYVGRKPYNLDQLFANQHISSSLT